MVGCNRLEGNLLFIDPLYLYDKHYYYTHVIEVPFIFDKTNSFKRNYFMQFINTLIYNLYLIFSDYIFSKYSSSLLSMIYKYMVIINIFIIFVFLLLKDEEEYNYFLAEDFRFLVYIESFYILKLSKIRNFLNKLWF